MASYKDKHGRWRYRFTRKGVRYSGSTLPGHNTKAAADRLERTHIDKLERNVYTGVVPTFAAFADRFIDFQKAHTAQLTQENQARAIGYCKKVLGSKRLDDIGNVDVDELVAGWRKGGAKPRTCNARLDTLQRLFSIAVEWSVITIGPKIRRIKVPQDTPRFLNFDEAERLLKVAVAEPRWRSMVLIGLRTGLRIGELRGLQWGDIDLRRRVIQVRRTDPGRLNLLPNAPKGKRERTIPLSADALACLVELAGAEPRASADQVWPGSAPVRGDRGRRATAHRKARTVSSCGYAIKRLLKAAGIEGEAVEDATDRSAWHTLRHTFASWLVMRGVPLIRVQELLGHADIKQTMRYAHLSPDFAQHDAVAGLDFPLAKEPFQLPKGNTDEPGKDPSDPE